MLRTLGGYGYKLAVKVTEGCIMVLLMNIKQENAQNKSKIQKGLSYWLVSFSCFSF